MISIYVIFISLAATALAKGSIECSFLETTRVQQCFGAVGQLLVFHLLNTANTDVRLKKDNKYMIFKVKKHNVALHEEYVDHQASFTDGTLRLGNAMKKHSGDYVLEEFGSNGALLKNVTVHLEIQAPVSKPAVSQECLSPEQMNIGCSSEGDAVQFILTLEGLLPNQTKGHSQSPSSWTANMQPQAVNNNERGKPTISNVIISLDGQPTGNVVCQVWNNVSRDETVIHLQSCKAFISHLYVILAVRAGVITLLILALSLGVCYVHKKTRPMTVKEGISRMAEPSSVFPLGFSSAAGEGSPGSRGSVNK